MKLPLDDLRFANKLLQEAKESSDDGFFFKSGLFTWHKMEILTSTDASFGNESKFRSQKGRMFFLTGPDSFDKYGMGVHLIGYSSTIIGRMCWSTLQAETYALSDGVEESTRLRAALADAHGVFLRTDCECHTARFMRNVWMIDCNSLNDHLRNPTFTKCSDKRLRCVKWPGSLLMEIYEKNRIRSARHGEMDRHKLHGGRLSY